MPVEASAELEDAVVISGSSGQDSTVIRAVKDITFGSIAGMVSKVFEHPFDLTKVRLQSQVLDAQARFNGPIDCLRKTWINEGIRGLYRGLPAPIVGAMFENASLFLAYGEFQRVIRTLTQQPYNSQLSMGQICIAAAGAGAVTSVFLTPIELIKCKMQVQMLVTPSTSQTTLAKLPGPISVLTSVIRSTGLRGLWVGQSGTFIRETGGTAIWFGTKEFVASFLISRRVSDPDNSGKSPTPLRSWESALSGACAGAMFNLTLFPADSVKSVMQTEEELRPRTSLPSLSGSGTQHQQSKSTFFSTFRAMYRAQGIRGLYAGCGITIARSIPSSGLIFLIYDGLCRYFG